MKKLKNKKEVQLIKSVQGSVRWPKLDTKNIVNRGFACFISKYASWAETSEPKLTVIIGDEHLDQKPTPGNIYFSRKSDAEKLESKITKFLRRLGYSSTDISVGAMWLNTYPGELGVMVEILV